MTTRAEIDAVIERWGETDTVSLPPLLRGIEDALPLSKHQFALAFALATHKKWGDAVGPIYDENDTLIGWRGVGLKNVR